VCVCVRVRVPLCVSVCVCVRVGWCTGRVAPVCGCCRHTTRAT
jgi:hypothetical protein